MATTRRKKEDAIQLLKQDHREVEMLFKEFEKLEQEGGGAVEPIIATACTELKIHDKLETELFYPAIREGASEEELADVLDEAEVEHTSVRELIQKIEGMSGSDEKRNAHFTVLMEYVKHHVKEEEKEMFPKVKKLEVDLKSLGARMKERKMELMEEMGVAVEELEEQDETA
ncbi:MAG TPA: hemerythrin domain-containing protein [Burkholderiales bacterium]|nr:hemerythrin domain-containing protein [Burkholderiales bacterium]